MTSRVVDDTGGADVRGRVDDDEGMDRGNGGWAQDDAGVFGWHGNFGAI